jgi:putative sterol carrier protein
MIDDIFNTMPDIFIAHTLKEPMSFYFTMGESKKTVRLTPDECLVSDGKAVDSADCVCKTSTDFFLKIWQEDYRPGMKDFLSGTIKSNNPGALQTFLTCFGK